MRHALTLALQLRRPHGGSCRTTGPELRATCDRFCSSTTPHPAVRRRPDDYRDWLAERRAQASECGKCPDRSADKAPARPPRTSAPERQARLAARPVTLVKERDQLEK